jgi:hypothetical protein
MVFQKLLHKAVMGWGPAIPVDLRVGCNLGSVLYRHPNSFSPIQLLRSFHRLAKAACHCEFLDRYCH